MKAAEALNKIRRADKILAITKIAEFQGDEPWWSRGFNITKAEARRNVLYFAKNAPDAELNIVEAVSKSDSGTGFEWRTLIIGL